MVQPLPPFMGFVNKTIPTAFENSMSYYDTLCVLYNYLHDEILPQINEDVEKIAKLTTLCNELKDYVDNYFDNLDVQQEINNKLDEMAESGELEEIIVNYLSGSVNVIFPDYGKDGTDTLGDCSIIKTANKAIMIDCFADDATCWGRISEALYQAGITRLDYFIVSHYDGDHYGNYQRLIASGLLDNNTTIILPRSVVQGSINKTGNDIKTALTNAGLTYQTANNQTVNIDTNVTMKMFNASTSDYAYYDAIPETDYNNYSVCCEFDCYGKKLLFTGDCLYNAFVHITNEGYISSDYELYKESHHGFSNYYNEFNRLVKPNFVLVPASNGMIMKNLGYRGTITPTFAWQTSNIYVQGSQDEAINFKVGTTGTQVVSNSYSTQEAGADGEITFVVDSTTTSQIRNGSEAHPFKNLAEANFLMPKNSNLSLNVQVLHLGEETTQVHFAGYKRLHINFRNNAIPHYLRFQDIAYLGLTNVNLGDSQLEINYCPSVVINGLTSSYTGEGSQVKITESTVQFKGDLTSTGAETSCISASFSTLYFSLSTLSYTQASVSARLITGYNDIINMTTGSIALFHNYKLLCELMNKADVKQCIIGCYDKLAEIYTSDSPTYDEGNFTDKLALYDGVKVIYQTNDSHQFVEEYYDITQNQYPHLDELSTGGTYIYKKMCMYLPNTTNNKFSLARQYSFDVKVADSSILATQTNSVGVMKVIGLLKR